jgi:hypothetical protein
VTSTSIPDADTADISEEAKSLSQHAGKAKPHAIAEALGVKNFGQALKALRKTGVDLSHGFVSKLVHGDTDALEQAKAALAPPAEDATEPAADTDASEGASDSSPIDSTPQPTDTAIMPETPTESEPPQAPTT